MRNERSTVTTCADDAGDGASALGPALFVVLDSVRPHAGTARCALAGVDTVVIGRADRRAARRETAGADRVLRLDLPDDRMSTVHARLERALGKWVITDAGSKNGTFVNRERTERRALANGDVIELGRTFLRFRAAVAPADAPVFVDARDLAAPARGMRTTLPELARAFDALAVIARSTVSVVLSGETGTGKEVMARAVHELSGRRGRFVAVNCGAIAANLVESELFGHARGAFSGATEDRLGHVRTADGGTLLLDEIGDLPLPAQAALLRVLQEREVTPVGASTPVPVDVRVVAASHLDLPALAADGRFRADLLARLGGHHLELPALRDRREDLGLLLGELLPDGVALSREAARAVLAHDWPHNVRELQRCLETAVALAGGRDLELADFPAAVRAALRDPAAPDELSPDEQQLKDRIVALLTEHRGNVSAVARDLGRARPQVHRWLKRFDIDPDRYR